VREREGEREGERGGEGERERKREKERETHTHRKREKQRTYSIFEELLDRVEEGEDAVPFLHRVEPRQQAQVFYHPSQQGLHTNLRLEMLPR